MIIDLKRGKLSVRDVGQMDMYVRMYDELMRGEDDKPPASVSAASATLQKPTCASSRRSSANNKSDISPFFAAHTKPHYGPSL